MQNLTPDLNPEHLFLAGAAGLALGIIFILFFMIRRLLRVMPSYRKNKRSLPGVFASLRNLTLTLFWCALSGTILFLGLFLRAYSSFTFEKPVAKIVTRPMEQSDSHLITFVEFKSDGSGEVKQISRYLIKGDQWMLEGNIVKWDNWLNFLGVDTGYRFTRLRGRYRNTTTESRSDPTVYALNGSENNLIWRSLFRVGHELPFISTVYGNTVYQDSGREREFMIYVTASGFIARESKDKS